MWMDSGLEIVRDRVVAWYDGCAYIASANLWESDLYEVDSGARDALMDYLWDAIDTVLSLWEKKKTMRCVIDCGNGVGRYSFELLQSKLPDRIEIIPLYRDVDGTFPNHLPDPYHDPANIKDLRSLVSEKNADVGVAFDGDADRIVVVDNNGNVVQGDFMVRFFAEYMIESMRGMDDENRRIVAPISHSRTIGHGVYEQWWIMISSRHGRTNVSAMMVAEQALYGGENTGHHFFAAFDGMDSWVLATALLFSFLSHQSDPLSTLVERLTSYYHIQPEINIRLSSNEQYDEIVDALSLYFSEALINTMEGVTFFYPTRKMTIRKSQTEPKIRLLMECYGEESLEKKVSEIEAIIARSMDQ